MISQVDFLDDYAEHKELLPNTHSVTMTAGFPGTKGWMSPEMCRQVDNAKKPNTDHIPEKIVRKTINENYY